MDQGVFVIMIQLFVNPSVYGSLRKLLHEYVPMVEVGVDFAIRKTFIVRAIRLVDSRMRNTLPSGSPGKLFLLR